MIAGNNSIPAEGKDMPTGFNAMVALNTFLAVLIVGTAWRLLSLHLVATGNQTYRNLGTAMAFQY
jgi:hypothetical protein